MGMFGGSIRMVPNRSFLSLSDSRQLSRVSIGCLVHVALPLQSTKHTHPGVSPSRPNEEVNCGTHTVGSFIHSVIVAAITSQV